MLWPMNTRSHEDLDALLAQWRLRQESKRLAERTINERAATIRAYIAFSGEHPLKITADGIVRFIARRELKPNSAVTYYAAIRAFCAWLVRTGRRKTDPAVLIEDDKPKKPKSKPRPLSEEQLRRTLQKATRRRARAMILLAAYAGLRVHEIAKIRGEDFDPIASSLRVVGKGDKDATIGLDADLIAELGALGMPRRGLWFPGYGERADQPITSRAVASAITSAMRRAGIYHATPHQLRHFYGTQLVAGEVNLRVVQELMRHSSVTSTQIYTDVTLLQQREGVRSLGVRAMLDSLDEAA